MWKECSCTVVQTFFGIALLWDWNENWSPSWITTFLWRRSLCNSMKLWAMLCRATQDRWIIVKSSDKTWYTRGRNGNPLQYSCHENAMNSMKKQKDMTPEDEPSRAKAFQYVTREEWRAVTNSSRKNEVAGPRQKWHSIVDVSGDESKVQCHKGPIA